MFGVYLLAEDWPQVISMSIKTHQTKKIKGADRQ